MANIFSSDSSCKALWTFEGTSATFTTDKIGSNDLVNNNSVEPDAVNYKEGTQGADLTKSANQSLYITDANLDAGVPFRYADGASVKKDITVACWMNLLTTATGTNMGLYNKYNSSANERSFSIYMNGANSLIYLLKGYNNGVSTEVENYVTKVDKNTWYYIGVGYRDSDKSYNITIWDDTAGSELGAVVSGSFSETTYVTDEPLLLGATNSANSYNIDGYMDEIVVFNKKKPLAAIDQIRQGQYGHNTFSSDSSCVALWTFDDTPGLSTDSIAGIVASAVGDNYTSSSTCKEGSLSLEMVAASTSIWTVSDTSLVTGFPFRNHDGASVKKDITFCTWYYGVTTASAKSHDLFRKYSTGADKRSFWVTLRETDNKIHVFKGYNAGASFETDNFNTKCDKSIWYYFSIGYREHDKSYYVRVWDDNAGDYLGSDLTGNFAQTTSIEDVDFTIANNNGGFYLDEYIVFNKKKTLADVDRIRGGTYHYQDFSNQSLHLTTTLNMLGGG